MKKKRNDLPIIDPAGQWKDKSVRIRFRLDQYQMITFPNISSLNNIQSCYYYVPSVGNLGTGDSFAIVEDQICIFQITVSKHHPVNGKELRKLISSILSQSLIDLASKPIRLIFVVPDFIANFFPHQQIAKKDVSVNEGSQYELKAIEEAAYKWLPTELKNVEQFVLGIKLLPEYRIHNN
jgi:hypothetical protein